MRALFQRLPSLLKDRSVVILLIILTCSALLIMLVNYNTIKTLSAIRAYIQGEGHYSKGEKDASEDLILYLDTRDELHLQDFYKNVAIPQGDSLARELLMDNGDEAQIRSGFLAGRNHSDDVDNMIWLFRNFKDGSFMKEPIAIWKEADSLVYEKVKIAEDIQLRIDTGAITSEQKTEFLKRIVDNSNQLTTLERSFSAIMGNIARKASDYLFYFNLTITVLIFLLAEFYIVRIIAQSRQRNEELRVINHELDKFLYSASHDLRAPISSVKGLVALSQIESDPEAIKRYLELMKVALEKQDRFIKDIIDFSRNKRVEVKLDEVDLNAMIDEVISNHSYMPGADRIVFKKEIVTEKILSDVLRIEIILNNLVSNAIKYSDQRKHNSYITVRTYPANMSVNIEVEDNGIGIGKENLEKIFQMFYVTHHDNKGTGLGLYITKETVSRLGGVIDVSSEQGEKTRFTVRLPVLDRSHLATEKPGVPGSNVKETASSKG